MPLVAENVRTLYVSLVVAALIIAGLVLGREVLIPIAIGACLAFVLTPIVSWLTAKRLPHSLAVLLPISIVMVALAGITTMLASELASLTDDVARHQHNLIEKVRSVVGGASEGGKLKQARDAISALEKGITRELNGGQTTAPANGSGAPAPASSEQTSLFDHLLDQLGGVLNVLAMAGLTLLFTLFMLLQSRDLLERVVRVAGTDNVSGTTAALSDAADRLSRLFLTQAAMNIGFGIAVGLLLWLIGLPNSALWGGLAMVMRFVPYVGSFIAAVPPLLLAAAVDPGWGMTLAVLAVFALGEPLMGHVIEPLVLGPKAGLSPFAMLASASFWALVWGPVGLILAAPLTMTLVVLGRYVKGLEFLTVMLGDDPALSPEQQFYHRLLAGDALAAIEQLDDAEGSAMAASDAIILPALRLAAADAELGRIDRARAEEMRSTLNDVLKEIDLDDGEEEKAGPEKRDDQSHVLIIPARTAFDAACAALVAKSVEARLGVRAVALTASSGLSAISQAATDLDDSIEAVVIVSTGEADSQYLPLISRRALKSFAGAKIVVLDASGSAIPPKLPDGVNRQRRLVELIGQLAPVVMLTDAGARVERVAAAQ